jgi:CRP-like cAMP-binding protein
MAGRSPTCTFRTAAFFSVTNELRDGGLVEVATVGCEGMLGTGAFLGDRLGAGRTFQQVADGRLPSMNVRRFVTESASAGPFHDILALYAQANLLQIMQGTACNALHDVKARCCRWLLQTQDRVESEEFLLTHDFLAIMLGVHRPTVTLVIGALQKAGLISSRHGRIRVLKRKRLENASCEWRFPRFWPRVRASGVFEVEAFAGAGGMGEVYRARDTRLGRRVALKVLSADSASDPRRRARFVFEARAIARLSHPNICALPDLGHHEGLDFLVMEYLHGETLAWRLRNGPFSVADAVHIAIQIAEAGVKRRQSRNVGACFLALVKKIGRRDDQSR